MIVVDTNTIVYFYLDTAQSKLADAVNERDPNWVAPPLWKSEFRNVLTLYLHKELLSLEQATAISEQTEAGMADREFGVSSPLVLELAAGSGRSAYDCEFVALALQFEVPLVTADRRLRRAFPGIGVSLEEFAFGES